MTPSRREIRRSLRTDFTPSARLRLIRAAHVARRGANVPALVLGAELDRPVFIVGAPRSGTSLLYAVLRRSSALRHWPGESHEIWEADYHPALRGWSSNVLTADDVTPEAAARIKRSFFLVTGRRHRLIDKTPRNALRVGFVDAVFPDARFIFLKRDGRENVNSLINAWRTPRYRTYRLPEPHAIPGVDPAWWKFVLYPGWETDRSGPLAVVCANQWVASNDHARSDLARISPDRVFELRYEDLIDDPVATVGDIVSFLDLAYEDAVRAKAAATATTPVNVVTPPEPGKWKRENPAEIASIAELIAPTMRALGYVS
ncbi:MAG TPA: sulfotransferase [Actinomycetota bacterium]|nr:sulfotransferase [Actinomycetota bacterium]